MTNWRELSEALGIVLHGDSARPQSGGSISTAYRVESANGPVFVKLEPVRNADRLLAEADGLAALAATGTLRVPEVLGSGTAGADTKDDVTDTHSGTAFLAIEWIDAGRGSDAAAMLGAGLAAMHRVSANEFGWHRDNYIGASPQPNTASGDWVDFLREQRIGFQLALAERNGYRLRSAEVEDLLQNLGAFYSDYRPRPSLLHGDLWGGNWFSDVDGVPVIFDPAVYNGDREADLAMTELFGGFGEDFYSAYAEAWALDPGYAVRRDLHKLYHVLNHLNLFGGGYLGQARQLLNRLGAELR